MGVEMNAPRLLPLFLIGCLAVPAQADPPGPDWFLLDRPDLHAHLWLSYGLALTLTEVLEGPEPGWGPQWGTTKATLIATGIVGAIGLLKEYVVDDRADGADLVADALGLGLNAALQFTVSF
ncbi:MAG: hypothetical protein ACI9U2_004117 [Bradymonadia bacterium]|jgi:hypothetical protein